MLSFKTLLVQMQELAQAQGAVPGGTEKLIWHFRVGKGRGRQIRKSASLSPLGWRARAFS
jgi:hypothetical protein